MRRCFLLLGVTLTAVLAESSTFTEKWSYPTSGAVYASPAIDGDGNIYFGARDNRVYAVRPDGSALWTTEAYGDWIDSSPTLLSDGGLVVGSWDFSVYCFEQASGALRWSYTTGGAVTASPAVGTGGTIFVASTDGTVTALDPSDGSVKWIYISASQGDIETSIAIDEDRNLYFADSLGTAISLTAQGGLRWSVNLASHSQSRYTDFEVFGSPALSGDGEVYFGTRSQELFSLDSTDGAFEWSYVFYEWVDSSPVLLSDGSILTVSREGDLTRLSKAGFEIWTRDVGEVLYSAPAVDAADRIYIAGYVGSNQTRISCLDIAGNLIDSVLVGGINDSSPNIAPDGTLYMGMGNNRLVAFEGGGESLSRTSIWPRFRQGLDQSGQYNGFDPIVMDYFPSAFTTDGEWYKLDWLGSGWLNGLYFPWVYHIEHEWLYCSGEGGGDKYWFYDLLLGWVYTSSDWTDAFYNQNLDTWMFYQVGSSLLNTSGRWFYDFGTDEWSQEDAFYLNK